MSGRTLVMEFGLTTTPLLEYLRKKNLTYEEFAAVSGVSASYLFRVATGQREASVAVMRKIAKATGGALRVADLVA